MKNIEKFVVSMLFFIVLSGCSSQPEFVPYEGAGLSIAVVGQAPDVKESQVEFDEISFDEFNEVALRKYDAVFIMKENLSEAAESEYASVYTGVHIPLFFIESNKDAYPFIDPELAYEDAREIPYHDYYATSFLQMDTGEQTTVTYGLHNDEETEEHVQALYSQLFSSIETSGKGQ